MDQGEGPSPYSFTEEEVELLLEPVGARSASPGTLLGSPRRQVADQPTVAGPLLVTATTSVVTTTSGSACTTTVSSGNTRTALVSPADLVRSAESSSGGRGATRGGSKRSAKRAIRRQKRAAEAAGTGGAKAPTGKAGVRILSDPAKAEDSACEAGATRKSGPSSASAESAPMESETPAAEGAPSPADSRAPEAAAEAMMVEEESDRGEAARAASSAGRISSASLAEAVARQAACSWADVDEDMAGDASHEVAFAEAKAYCMLAERRLGETPMRWAPAHVWKDFPVGKILALRKRAGEDPSLDCASGLEALSVAREFALRERREHKRAEKDLARERKRKAPPASSVPALAEGVPSTSKATPSGAKRVVEKRKRPTPGNADEAAKLVQREGGAAQRTGPREGGAAQGTTSREGCASQEEVPREGEASGGQVQRVGGAPCGQEGEGGCRETEVLQSLEAEAAPRAR